MSEEKTASSETLMRALVVSGYGETKDVMSVQDVPKPVLSGPANVLIRVKAGSINPVDYKLSHGKMEALIKIKFPFIPGFDVAGEVVEVGTGCQRLKVGDNVMADLGRDCGAFAEFVQCPEDICAVKPEKMSFGEAAALPLAGLTSYQGLYTKGKFQTGHKVLILGGSGGTGCLGIQIAKAGGASEVATTCSTRNVDFVTKMGATTVVDYTKSDWGEQLKGQNFDLIYDCVGGAEAWVKAQGVLGSKGTFVTLVGDKGGSKATVGSLVTTGLSIANRKFWSMFPYPDYALFLTDSKDRKSLEALASLVSEGKLTVPLDKSFAFKDAVEMFTYMEGGKASGKVVLDFAL